MSAALERLVARALPGGSPTWFQELLGWVLCDAPPAERTSRLLALRAAIDAHPMCDTLVARLCERWNDPSMVRFLAETGIPAQLSLVHELFHRASISLLPRVRDEHDIGETFTDLAVTQSHAAWLDAIPTETLAAWRDVLPSRAVLMHAARLTAVRAAGAGLTTYLLHLAGNPPVQDSPFLELAARMAATVEAERTGAPLARLAGVAGARAQLPGLAREPHRPPRCVDGGGVPARAARRAAGAAWHAHAAGDAAGASRGRGTSPRTCFAPWRPSAASPTWCARPRSGSRGRWSNSPARRARTTRCARVRSGRRTSTARSPRAS
jgi:hypothetical protein